MEKMMDNLRYTNEFLKNLEAIIRKNNQELLIEIKETIKKIADGKEEKITLKNTQTHQKNEIYLTQIKTQKESYNCLWTKREEEKIILCLIKSQ